MGRPTKLNLDMLEGFGNLLRKGQTIDTSCALMGVDIQTYYNWMNRGKTARRGSLHRVFFEHCTRAKADYIQGLHESIDKRARGYEYTESFVEEIEKNGQVVRTVKRASNRTMPPDPAAAKWLISRKAPADYARPPELELDSHAAPPEIEIVYAEPPRWDAEGNLITGEHDDSTPDPEPGTVAAQ